MRLAGFAIRADEAHGDAAILAHDVEDDLAAVKPDRAPALALHGPADHLARNLPLALAEHMIDRGTDCGQPPRDFAFRRMRGKPAWKLLCDEARREFSLAPAWMVHKRRQERNVVANAIDIKRVERRRLRLDRGGARRTVRH